MCLYFELFRNQEARTPPRELEIGPRHLPFASWCRALVVFSQRINYRTHSPDHQLDDPPRHLSPPPMHSSVYCHRPPTDRDFSLIASFEFAAKWSPPWRRQKADAFERRMNNARTNNGMRWSALPSGWCPTPKIWGEFSAIVSLQL